MGDQEKETRLLIIGGGPAGLTAALYACRSRLSTLLIERGMPGGYMALTDRIDNYPGFPDGIGGPELAAAMDQQARKFGMETVIDTVIEVKPSDSGFAVKGENGIYRAKAVIITAGSDLRRLGVPGEEDFLGRGVSFCATCDGAFFKGQEVAVVGGGNTAVDEALFLTRFASKVHLIHRRDALRADKILQEEAMANSVITIHWSRVVTAIKGGEAGVDQVILKDVNTNQEEPLAVQGVFVFIGYLPRVDFLPPEVKKDDRGFIITDQAMQTSIPGLFAAGDIRSKNLRQVTTAVGDGATAAFSAGVYLEQLARAGTT